MLFCNGPHWRRQNLPTSETPKGWDQAERACWCPQTFRSIGPGEQTLLTLAQGQHFQFPASPPCSPSASILNQACMPLLRGQNKEKVGSWLKNSNLPLIKVFFENEYILRFEFSKNKNDKMVLLSKSIPLSHIHRGRKPQTLHVPGTVKWPKCYKINQ